MHYWTLIFIYCLGVGPIIGNGENCYSQEYLSQHSLDGKNKFDLSVEKHYIVYDSSSSNPELRDRKIGPAEKSKSFYLSLNFTEPNPVYKASANVYRCGFLFVIVEEAGGSVSTIHFDRLPYLLTLGRAKIGTKITVMYSPSSNIVASFNLGSFNNERMVLPVTLKLEVEFLIILRNHDCPSV